MSNNFHYQHEESMDTIRSVAMELLDLSSSFFIVGNDTLGDRFHDMAAKLATATKNATQARRGQLNEQYNESQSDIGTIISALLNTPNPK